MKNIPKQKAGNIFKEYMSLDEMVGTIVAISGVVVAIPDIGNPLGGVVMTLGGASYALYAKETGKTHLTNLYGRVKSYLGRGKDDTIQFSSALGDADPNRYGFNFKEPDKHKN